MIVFACVACSTFIRSLMPIDIALVAPRLCRSHCRCH
jgi:hypothetical protein